LRRCALKLHRAVERSRFIAPPCTQPSLAHSIDACHPLGAEFFRPFYLTHVIRLASNFSALSMTHVVRLASNFSTYCIIDPLGDADCKNDVM
jgi:hypothetical protein